MNKKEELKEELNRLKVEIKEKEEIKKLKTELDNLKEQNRKKSFLEKSFKKIWDKI